MSKKQTVFNLLFLVVVFGLTMYLVFRGKDIGDIISTAREADARYLLLSIVCVVLFILGESVIIFYMMRTLGTSVKMGHCALYSFVGFFFSCITPSASGGQPMQIFYMKKDKLPIPVTTLVLMIVTITYKAVLVVIGPVWRRISSWLSGRLHVGVLPWGRPECILRHFYDDTGVCSRACQMDHGNGAEAYRAHPDSEAKEEQT